MIAIGSDAPQFVLSDQDGNEVSLASLLADGAFLLYFYPADFTPGCTREACSLRDMHDDIVNSGLRVVGISPQDSDSHRRFATEHELPFTLLADPDKQAVHAYDVDGPLGFGVRRASFLIDAEGKIADAIQADFMIAKHEAFFRRVMATAAQE
ncbi:MAG: peroxiredoxin [Gammaproteobacteria bacterium]|nr:peroxiredoxin [Gammaproteobacteria bacterium]NND59188.1 peroxiredoxin [Gammaproteobacteria bacterium]